MKRKTAKTEQELSHELYGVDNDCEASLTYKKPKQKDLYFKDEGDMITVIFQSKKAQKIIKAQGKEVVDKMYGNKLDIDAVSSTAMLTWAISHNLTTEGDVTFTIKSK